MGMGNKLPQTVNGKEQPRADGSQGHMEQRFTKSCFGKEYIHQKGRGWDKAVSIYASRPPRGEADPLGLSLELFSSLSTQSKSH